jgi:small subunit ribosomal protein S15
MATKKTTKKETTKPVSQSKKTAEDKQVKLATAKATPVKKAAKKAAKKAVKEEVAPNPTPQKQVIIDQFKVKDGDTGSPEVQVALLSSRIEKLISHLKINPADNHSRRGLLGIVSKRRRLLNYLEKKDAKRYEEVTKKLGLGK